MPGLSLPAQGTSYCLLQQGTLTVQVCYTTVWCNTVQNSRYVSRDCHRRLSRGRCPVCLSSFSRPPARNFLAESLLEEVARPCSWHHLGCTVTSWGSPQLAKHEETCRHREKPGRGREDSQEASLACLLARVVRIAVLVFLVVSPYILSYVLYQYLVYGSFQLCCLPPYLLPSSSGLQDLALGGTFAVFRGLEEVLLLPALGLFSSLVRLAQEPAVCLPSTTVSLYWHWPDTFLPAHLDSMVRRHHLLAQPRIVTLVPRSGDPSWPTSSMTPSSWTGSSATTPSPRERRPGACSPRSCSLRS